MILLLVYLCIEPRIQFSNRGRVRTRQNWHSRHEVSPIFIIIINDPDLYESIESRTHDLRRRRNVFFAMQVTPWHGFWRHFDGELQTAFRYELPSRVIVMNAME